MCGRIAPLVKALMLPHSTGAFQGVMKVLHIPLLVSFDLKTLTFDSTIHIICVSIISIVWKHMIAGRSFRRDIIQIAFACCAQLESITCVSTTTRCGTLFTWYIARVQNACLSLKYLQPKGFIVVRGSRYESDWLVYITVEIRYSWTRGDLQVGTANEFVQAFGACSSLRVIRRRTVCRRSVEDVRKQNETSSAATLSQDATPRGLIVCYGARAKRKQPQAAGTVLCRPDRYPPRCKRRSTSFCRSIFVEYVRSSVRPSVAAPWTRTCRRQVNSLVLSAGDVTRLGERESTPTSASQPPFPAGERDKQSWSQA